MHHIHKSQIKPEIREPYENQYKETLRVQLRIHGLPDKHKNAIKRHLQEVGKMKRYPSFKEEKS